MKTINLSISMNDNSPTLSTDYADKFIGSMWDSGAQRLVFTRPAKLADLNMRLLFRPGSDAWIAVDIGSENAYTLTNAFTQQPTLTVQCAFLEGETVRCSTNAAMFRFRHCAQDGAVPEDIEDHWQRVESAISDAKSAIVQETASLTQAGIVQLSDSVSSTSTTMAATPSAVKSAYDLANAKAPTSHASTTTTYGIGTTTNYGHVKTINALTQTAHADGTALSAYQGYVLSTNKAPLASPALTGTPTAPTAATGTSTTQLATTAFVQSAIATVGGGSSDLVESSGTLDVYVPGRPNFYCEAHYCRIGNLVTVSFCATGHWDGNFMYFAGLPSSERTQEFFGGVHDELPGTLMNDGYLPNGFMLEGDTLCPLLLNPSGGSEYFNGQADGQISFAVTMTYYTSD